MASILINSVSPTTNPAVKNARKSQASRFHLYSFPENRDFSAIAGLSMSPKDSVFSLPKWSKSSKNYDPQLQGLFLYFENMVGQGYKPDAYQANQLLRYLARCKRFKKAIKAIELMMSSGCPLDPRSCNMVVDQLCKCYQVSKAAWLVQKLEDNGFPTTVVTYNILVKGYCLVCNFKRARLYMNKMIQRGLVPNFHTYSILIGATCEESGVDAAMELLDDMISRGLRPNIVSYNTLLIGLSNEHRVDDAMKFFRDFLSRGLRPNIVSYNTLLIGLSKEHRVDDAMKFFRDFLSMGVTPTVVTYKILVRTLCNEGRWKEVNEILAEMVDVCSPDKDMYNMLVNVLALQGRTDDALGLAKEMARRAFKPTAITYNPIIHNLCKWRKVNDVLKCLHEMRHCRCEPNYGTYTALAVLCKKGMVQEAFFLIESLSTAESFHSMHDFYMHVISTLCKKNNTHSAFQLLYEMIKRGFTPDAYTYSSLIRGLCNERMENVALQIIGIMEESVYKATADNYNALLHGLCRNGKICVSLEVFSRMIDKGCMPDETTYKIILHGFVIVEEMELAALVLKELYSRQLVGREVVKNLVRHYEFEDFLAPST